MVLQLRQNSIKSSFDTARKRNRKKGNETNKEENKIRSDCSNWGSISDVLLGCE